VIRIIFRHTGVRSNLIHDLLSKNGLTPSSGHHGDVDGDYELTSLDGDPQAEARVREELRRVPWVRSVVTADTVEGLHSC
jgi:hypothetical protein